MEVLSTWPVPHHEVCGHLRYLYYKQDCVSEDLRFDLLAGLAYGEASSGALDRTPVPPHHEHGRLHHAQPVFCIILDIRIIAPASRPR